MATITLPKERWKSYFETVTHALEGKQALIEVDALPLGSQVAVEWLPLLGVTYDDKDDLVDLDLGDVNHLISHPSTIHVEAEASDVRTIEIIDAGGVKQIVRLREPLMLPKPA